MTSMLRERGRREGEIVILDFWDNVGFTFLLNPFQSIDS